MAKLSVKSNPKVDDIFTNYPDAVRDKMKFLRGLVIETAEETEGIDELEETQKWGQLTKNRSRLECAAGVGQRAFRVSIFLNFSSKIPIFISSQLCGMII